MGSSSKSSGYTGTAITTAGGLLGGLMSSITAGAISAQNRKYDAQVRAEELERDKEKMQLSSELSRQNFDHEFTTKAEYQDPAAEKARYEAAGLNPSLMYGGSGGSSISASTSSTPISGGNHSPGNLSPMPDTGSILAKTGEAASTSLYQSSLVKQAEAQTQAILAQTADPNASPGTPGYIAWQQMLSNADEKKYSAMLKEIELEIAKATKDSKIEMPGEQLRALRRAIERDDSVAESTIDMYNALADKAGEEKIDLMATRSSRIASNNASAREKNASAFTKELDNALYQATYMRPDENAISYATKLAAFKMAFDTLTEEEKNTLYSLGLIVQDGELTQEEKRKAFFLEKIESEEWKKMLKDIANKKK